MVLQDRVINLFHNTMEVNAQTIEEYTPLIAHAGELLLNCLISENKILCCGNGGSAALTQHFSALLINQFRHERPGLPAINLSSDGSAITGISDNGHYNDIFSKQIRALGQPGDLLIIASSDGRSQNLVQAIQAAHDREMLVIALTGGTNDNIQSLLLPDEVEFCIPADDYSLIYGAHLLVLHALCDLIDYQLFGGEE
ncbi:SIS domain-containing protein [Aliamphritea hakodatensis]|uniref:SIS domain-containing protein n=1 Tax=Aliamphritea hakodatensis TaxID=2895352 RepID=UPI0022FD45A0|nr:SIS domain-containing protein [Aliamphritea hakodatensis]